MNQQNLESSSKQHTFFAPMPINTVTYTVHTFTPESKNVNIVQMTWEILKNCLQYAMLCCAAESLHHSAFALLLHSLFTNKHFWTDMKKRRCVDKSIYTSYTQTSEWAKKNVCQSRMASCETFYDITMHIIILWTLRYSGKPAVIALWAEISNKRAMSRVWALVCVGRNHN